MSQPDPALSPAALDVLAELESLAGEYPEAPATVPVVAAVSGPVDRWFPRLGPCLICGVPGADQRHRVIEAIADRMAGGEGDEDVAADYGVPVEAVAACVRWVAVHPDGIERGKA